MTYLSIIDRYLQMISSYLEIIFRKNKIIAKFHIVKYLFYFIFSENDFQIAKKDETQPNAFR